MEARIWRLWVCVCVSVVLLFLALGYGLRNELAANQQLAVDVHRLVEELTTRVGATETRTTDLRVYVDREFGKIDQTFVNRAYLTDEQTFRAKLLQDLADLKIRIETLKETP